MGCLLKVCVFCLVTALLWEVFQSAAILGGIWVMWYTSNWVAKNATQNSQ
jgi:hypothetical protein